MLIKVKVKTKAKKDSVTKKSEDSLLVSVKEKPEDGLANKKVIELLREYLKVYNGRIRIVSGHHSPSKIINID